MVWVSASWSTNFSLKSQIVNILSFSGHMLSVSTLPLLCKSECGLRMVYSSEILFTKISCELCLGLSCRNTVGQLTSPCVKFKYSNTNNNNSCQFYGGSIMLPSALKEFIILLNPQNGCNNSNSSLWTIMIQNFSMM